MGRPLGRQGDQDMLVILRSLSPDSSSLTSATLFDGGNIGDDDYIAVDDDAGTVLMMEMFMHDGQEGAQLLTTSHWSLLGFLSSSTPSFFHHDPQPSSILHLHSSSLNTLLRKTSESCTTRNLFLL